MGSPQPGAIRRRILLLDDDAFMLELLQALLEEVGDFDVHAETNGLQALELLRTATPDLIICDLLMPHMDGVELLRHAAASHYRGGILLHSSADPALLRATERLAQAHGLHCVGTSRKPLDQAILIDALDRLNSITSTRPAKPKVDALQLDELRAGIHAGCVELVYQPKVSVRERRMVGVECLARWRHPERGLLGPDTFIPLIEEFNLIDEFTMVVLEQAARQLGQWQRAGQQFKIAVNVSMDNLVRLDLPERFVRVVKEAGVAPESVVLEMTETRLMDNLTVSLDILARLRLKGFGLSIDDFGTGFSTMENLGRLPFSELKIDRAFVDGASRDMAARSILESSIRLGRIFDLAIVAEGVETVEDWDVVAASGCDQVQGYFVARPLPAADLIAWKAQWESKVPAAEDSVPAPSA